MKLNELAQAGVSIGTSSWKYPGWCGQLYDEQRYLTRGKFSKKKFEETCVAEYAETFASVCVDAGYYQFPTEKWLEKLCGSVPAGFRFSFKVTDTITLKQFPNQPRHGRHAGQRNEHFLNAALFRESFLRPCESFREHIGALIFEFSQFYPRDFEHGRDFVEALDAFLSQLPAGWQFGVEIRNRTFLHREYFDDAARPRRRSRLQLVDADAAGERADGDAGQRHHGGRFLLPPRGRPYKERGGG